ncbi:hypothetical protein JCM5350_003456 [Sporobolomyces pararoseus]
MGKSTLKGAKKATKYRAREAEKEKPFDIKQSRLNKRMETYDDVMDGDEDQFHMNRDKMLLDEDGYAQNGDDDSLDEPDEIYGLNLPDRHSSDEEDEEEEEEEEVKKPLKKQKKERKEKKPIYDPKSGRFGHTYDPKQDQVFDSSSGSEASDDDDEDEDSAAPAKDQLESTVSSDDEEGKKGSGSDSEEDEDRWAAGHYHVSRRAPGEADSEDEEALELEAEEARRLQKKGAEKLKGEDYGLVDSDDEFDGKDKFEERLDLDGDDTDGKAAKDEEEGKVDTQALNEEESIAHLLKYSPETLALVDDFVRTASKIKDVESDLENIRTAGDGQGGEHPGLAIMELEHQALSTYLPTLAFYFSLLLSPTPQPQSLLTKVLHRISSLRQSLATMEELDLTTATYGEEDSEGEEGEEGEESFDDGKMLASEMFDFHNSLKENNEDDSEEDDEEDDEEGEEITESMLEGLDDDELEEIMQDVSPEEGAEGLMKRVRQRQREKGMEVPDSSDDGEGMSGDSEEEEEEEEEDEEFEAPPAKKAKKASTTPVIPTLAPLSASSRKQSSSTAARPAAATSDYLDPSALSHGDLADKASTRHSLRFHVSQVAQKAARRERLATAVGGDDDVPRRSKEQARREVLKKQQHGAKEANGEGLDGGDWDEEDRKAAKAVRGAVAGGDDGENDDDDDYYDLVKMEKDEGRKAKKAKYDGDRAAEKAEIEALSASMADGPRGATRQILANKGLTPRRKKENRNARVKKRLRYDKAQKKLSSMKATYKGGEARTGYEGEGSGISRKTVKSRQLG